MQPIGLICALPQEMEAFGDALIAGRTNKFSDKIIFHEGMIEGKAIVWVQSGVGKAGAAIVTALLKSIYNVPTIIFSGVAGGVDPALHPGDIVIADKTIVYDYGHYHSGKITTHRSGSNFLTNPDLPVAFPVSEKVREITSIILNNFKGDEFQGRTVSLFSGTILTGDVFLNDANKRDELFADFTAKAIEMEGGAVMQAAESCGIADVFIIRALSDRAGDDSHTDFPSLLHHAAPLAAMITKEIICLV